MDRLFLKRYYLIIVSFAFSLCAIAEDSISVSPRPDLLQEMTWVELLQDSMVSVLLQGAMNGKQEWVEIDGFRVQIYSSNQQQTAKAEALDLEQRMKEKINQTVYVQYLPPFWKVRIGDFRTYDEAKEYKQTLVHLFPNLMGNTYIVRDKIQVIQ